MSVPTSVKRAINILLKSINHVVVHRDHVGSVDRFVSAVHRAGLSPKTVIDVGVAFGTPWLYEGFKGAKLHLVDPTRESLPHMQEISRRIGAEIHNIALGEKSGAMEIALRKTIVHATLMKDVTGPEVTSRYAVPIVRFDELFPTVESPAFCKIDVEGAEMMVLRGMGEQIHSLDGIVVETSMIPLYEGGADFSELIQFMASNGFAFYDFAGVNRRPFDGALHQIDAFFVPNKSPLRVRRWA
jgi:FkbM family methyltransferase